MTHHVSSYNRPTRQLSSRYNLIFWFVIVVAVVLIFSFILGGVNTALTYARLPLLQQNSSSCSTGEWLFVAAGTAINKAPNDYPESWLGKAPTSMVVKIVNDQTSGWFEIDPSTLTGIQNAVHVWVLQTNFTTRIGCLQKQADGPK